MAYALFDKALIDSLGPEGIDLYSRASILDFGFLIFDILRIPARRNFQLSAFSFHLSNPQPACRSLWRRQVLIPQLSAYRAPHPSARLPVLRAQNRTLALFPDPQALCRPVKRFFNFPAELRTPRRRSARANGTHEPRGTQRTRRDREKMSK